MQTCKQLVRARTEGHLSRDPSLCVSIAYIIISTTHTHSLIHFAYTHKIIHYTHKHPSYTKSLNTHITNSYNKHTHHTLNILSTMGMRWHNMRQKESVYGLQETSFCIILHTERLHSSQNDFFFRLFVFIALHLGKNQTVISGRWSFFARHVLSPHGLLANRVPEN